ncbi:DUF7674 family protein [Campylobacter concisus]|uniref:DUF7674 domain-containing protein n=1 Tax=Campylobacter concisus TaxID=199 RepID=A0A7S9RHI8_9BACT|nr:hypothetical protein [Campylobacter concisus]QPH91931.1 hypothetical protein CVT01_05240 [Campylobacter concisus]
MVFAQNGNDLQSHKEIIYAFVSKDKRFFSEYQKELTRNLPLYPSLELLLIDFAVILVENFDQLSKQDKLEIFDLVEKNIKNDNYVGTSLLTGFIETIQNVSNKEQYKKIEKYFGKETLSLADKLIEFWGI